MVDSRPFMILKLKNQTQFQIKHVKPKKKETNQNDIEIKLDIAELAL